MISIIIPIYNTDKYLYRCIESVIHQTYKDLEIILVDDGSTDESGTICDRAANEDNRIRVIHQMNAGEAAARNVGLSVATGEWVCFLDSDDEYLPSAMEEMVKAVESGEDELVIGGYYEVSENNTHIALAHDKKYSEKSIARAVLNERGAYSDPYIFSTVNAKLFKRSIIQKNSIKFNEKFVVGNDSLFFCDYLKCIKEATNTLSAIYIYYKYNSNERVQGTGYIYPDIFILERIVASKLINIAEMEKKDRDNALTREYMNLIRGFTELISYEDSLLFDIQDYVSFCRMEIALFTEIAQIEDSVGIIVDKYKWGIPFEIISSLVSNKQDEILIELLRIINRKSKEKKGQHSKRDDQCNTSRVRRIIKL
uniref:glycosyltransferase family 2 protein n=1 Tax=Eubacterium cellulosolvens TaxID=29322 RepID=UPI00068499E0|nr:glycosyltransferase family 2 protein [[Eubacterium] cellulosolvens]